MFNHASGQLLHEHTWNPRCAQNFSWTHVQQDIRATVARARAKSPPRGSPSAHKAQRDVHATRLLRSHATGTLGSLSVRKQTCSGEKTAACSHAASTLGSLSVRKQTCSCDNTAAFTRCEHTWTSLRAQRDMFRRKSCCVLTPDAHLDLAPCANRHVPSKRLLRSHSASTLGSLSARKQEGMFMRQTAGFAGHKHTWISPCAKKHVPAKRLLRSHAASTL